MPIPGVTIRRATLDDLEPLRGLWRECRLPEYELEKRFTEFQLAVDAQDWILGALGLRFSGHDGQLHNLAIRRTDLETALLDALWSRVMALAEQHGALRLWTREHGPFWGKRGFAVADASQRRELPAAFGAGGETWQVRRIRDEPLKLIAAEEQLAAYLELERLKTERLVRRGQALKVVATAIAAVLFTLLLAVLIFVLRRRRNSPPR